MVLTPEEISWRTLDEKDHAACERARAVSQSDSVTVRDVANFTLFSCGLPDSLAGTDQFDRDSLAANAGLLEGITKGLAEKAEIKDLVRISSNSSALRKTAENGFSSPLFSSGLPLPLFGYTSDRDPGYTNENSSVIRYCVYVETEYDTDGDGKLDLVKVFLQIPRAALEGGYKAPVILECDPYVLGVINHSEVAIEPSDSYDLSLLYSRPAPRTVCGSVGAMEAAYSAKVTDWRSEGAHYLTERSYDYYLVRGYAVAICGGLGTYDSEGFVVTGTDIELSAFRSVIEWFDGESVAFTDRSGSISTAADWSNGNVGTMGHSYLGSIQIGLSAMGIGNLKAAVPSGAICSWYDYAYMQGAYINDPRPYHYSLSLYCSSRYTAETLTQQYRDYLSKVAYEEQILKGNYTDGTSEFWSARDYRNIGAHPGTAVLLVEGLNEDNVRTKQFDNSYTFFSEGGYTVKAILHQGAHQVLCSAMQDCVTGAFINGDMAVGDTPYSVIVDLWMSHYLFGQSNGAEGLPNISIQSNTDGSWSFRDDLSPSDTLTLESASVAVNSISKASYDSDPVFKTVSDSGRSMILFDVDGDTDIMGIIKVSFRASVTGLSDNTEICAFLYDVSGESFLSYRNLIKYRVGITADGGKVWTGSSLKDLSSVEYCFTEGVYCPISKGSVDMNNPSSGYDSATAVFESVSENTYYEYSIFMSPTVYEVKSGHKLAVGIYTFDPLYHGELPEPYSDHVATIDEGSVEVFFNVA